VARLWGRCVCIRRNHIRNVWLRWSSPITGLGDDANLVVVSEVYVRYFKFQIELISGIHHTQTKMNYLMVLPTIRHE
jgi:hypothetical protein